ncbi:phenylacetate-CoA oxygenase subunit PaaJ [Sulfitobacter mediterraneus]|uniref:1,2-phenylacetyl-CoA epoxidase subunit PaaD n=1 Tax=Sulfitobacter mediterraneus TaxID=83219 RepID=UPI0019398A39|nr:1,2-phenylacetyl-CoA epoxidase subunit PaaD [Sulfitobacter mediterraneus]MBM1555453.1 phenylacetate-CoA oxygenase subunit PaaJ [Sulfitobacter mediterraneus]MBM1566994.1 phenylacetate-CoA oxygenase subunit PaaJ [Sulfitobacter mediterraneus]MBM1570796.1 phenylacetate-CoA oxygenase subunit PaaJ [Sulfitobacter mediterraneus]MBM1574596.1 phenylacetate-CoA oxygenase subunit PaaJ [Sulfitobacter mediterraneus]MBM1578411.1 phenylacetate-CoA oxygenase subunit PaaJ [Sulfitobacter mediterraneus]
MVEERPTLETVWGWLDAVPDPEIPVISLTDLGIIRDVQWQGDTLEVTVTPTYSGCPATSIINLDIETALRAKGIEKLSLKRQLSPAWTTDWLSESGKAKLEDYGIAPPRPAGGPQHCPRCKSAKVERISQFGSTPCKAQWRCQSCLEPFDYFKCI